MNVDLVSKSELSILYQAKAILKPSKIPQLTYLAFSSKTGSASNICSKEKIEIAFNDTKNYSIFKRFFSNLGQNLVSELPHSPNVFTESKGASYYDNFQFKDLNFESSEISTEKIVNIRKG